MMILLMEAAVGFLAEGADVADDSCEEHRVPVKVHSANFWKTSKEHKAEKGILPIFMLY